MPIKSKTDRKKITTTKKDILKRISNAKNITITGHRNPDGDCICSGLALSLLIKKVFKKYERFFEFLFKYWVRDKNNLDNVNEFYKNLNIMFKKVAEFHGINPKIWSM